MSGVLVVLEHQNRNGSAALSRISLEALAAGQSLAKQLGMDCSAAVLGAGIAPLLEELSRKQLAKIFAIEHPLLAAYTADGTTTRTRAADPETRAGLCDLSAYVPGSRFRAGTGYALWPGADLRRDRDSGRAGVRSPALPGQAERRLQARGRGAVLRLRPGRRVSR